MSEPVTDSPHPSLDPLELRKTFGMFATGVTVITTVDTHGACHGLTVNSFSSVSLDPPLILWSQSVKAPSHEIFSKAPRFAVNILAEDQIPVSQRFAGGRPDKFSAVDTHPGAGNVPLIDGCCAYIECVTQAVIPGGDHTVYLGRVQRVARKAKPPLIFSDGRYMSVQPHEAMV